MGFICPPFTRRAPSICFLSKMPPLFLFGPCFGEIHGAGNPLYFTSFPKMPPLFFFGPCFGDTGRFWAPFCREPQNLFPGPRFRFFFGTLGRGAREAAAGGALDAPLPGSRGEDPRGGRPAGDATGRRKSSSRWPPRCFLAGAR